MPRNPRQRHRYQISKKQEKQKKILIASILTLIGILLISICFNISVTKKLEKNLTEEIVADKEAPEENQEEDIDPEMHAALNDDGSDNKEVKNEDITFTLSAIGDIMCHNTQYNDALVDKATNTYNFEYVFENIKYYTQVSDLIIGNLETTFAGAEKGYKSYPTFNTPDSLAKSLKSIGINVLTTANNHCLDAGYEGLERTIDILDNADIAHLGTYKTQESRDTVFTRYVKGVKIAILNYTYGTNGIKIPSDKEYSVNLINKDLITKDIAKAKQENADVIVACMHWGTEYQTSPNKEQTEMADFLFQNGVDVIFGNHPHVLQPMEKRTVTLADGTQKDGFVIYSLGNFTADQKAENTKNSIILNVKITKHLNGSITIDGADYVPINMFKYTENKTQKFKILDIERSLMAYDAGNLSLGSKNYAYLQKQLEAIKKAVGPEF